MLVGVIAYRERVHWIVSHQGHFIRNHVTRIYHRDTVVAEPKSSSLAFCHISVLVKDNKDIQRNIKRAGESWFHMALTAHLTMAKRYQKNTRKFVTDKRRKKKQKKLSVVKNLRLNPTSHLLQTIHKLLSQRSRSHNTTTRNLPHLLLVIQNSHCRLSHKKSGEEIHRSIVRQLAKHPLRRWDILVCRCDGAVLDAVVGRVLLGRAISGGVDVALQQCPNRRQEDERYSGHEGEVDGNADECVTHAQELAGEKAGAVEFGHEGTAAVNDTHICRSRGAGGERAKVAHGADSQDSGNKWLVGDLAGWLRGGKGVGVCDFLQIGGGKRFNDGQDSVESATAGSRCSKILLVKGNLLICWLGSVLHLFDGADHVSRLARELLTNSLNSRPGQDIRRCTFNSNGRDNLEYVSTLSPPI